MATILSGPVLVPPVTINFVKIRHFHSCVFMFICQYMYICVSTCTMTTFTSLLSVCIWTMCKSSVVYPYHHAVIYQNRARTSPLLPAQDQYRPDSGTLRHVGLIAISLPISLPCTYMKYMLSSLTFEFVFIGHAKLLVPDSITRFNIGPSNGLLPVGTKPLSETI